MPEATKSPNILIVGIGNDYRSDDGAGLYISRRIERENIIDVSVVSGIGDGTSLLDLWGNREHAILIDAVISGKPPGHIYKFDGFAEDISADSFVSFSTHVVGIPDTISLGKTLGQLPKKLTIYGIEGADFGPGNELSRPVKDAAEKLADEIIGKLKN